MKNGDVICLTQRVVTSLMETQVYDSSNTKLETTEDLQVLLDHINSEADENTVVEICLPPVTYEGDWEMTGRGINLFGSTEGDRQTTFTGTLTAAPENYEVMDIEGITFAGQGGTGLIASTGVNLRDCTVVGWDTGALAQDHGWISAQFCTFEDNGVGLDFNFGVSHYSDPDYKGNQFLNNGTALRLTRMTGEETLTFTYCSFLGNGTDIDNICGHAVDTSDAVFSGKP